MRTQTTRTPTINRHCRVCQEYCWGDCPGQRIEEFLTLEQIADGLGPPVEKKPSCWRRAENRDGDFDPATGDLLCETHEPILQG